jgi:hypothetical protein
MSDYTAMLSITEGAKSGRRTEQICRFTNYPTEKGKPYDLERSFPTPGDVADWTDNAFGHADTVRSVTEQKIRAFGWSPSVDPNKPFIGSSSWKGQGKSPPTWLTRSDMVLEDPSRFIFLTVNGTPTRLLLKNKQQGNDLFNTSKTLDMLPGQAHEVLIAVTEGEHKTQEDPSRREKWLVLQGACTVSATDIQRSIDYLELKSFKRPDLVSKLTLAKCFEDMMTEWAENGTEAHLSFMSNR